MYGGQLTQYDFRHHLGGLGADLGWLALALVEDNHRFLIYEIAASNLFALIFADHSSTTIRAIFAPAKSYPRTV